MAHASAAGLVAHASAVVSEGLNCSAPKRTLLSPKCGFGVAAMETTTPFAVALRDLIIEHDYATRSGNANWSAFAARLEGVHYETLRRAVSGDRQPSPKLMEECARVLGIRADTFVEYRIYLVRRSFDPAAVGLESAIKNLRLWTRALASPDMV